MNPTRSVDHYWLRLEHGKKFILDPTIRQFEKNFPKVYLGIQTEKYNEFPFNLENTLHAWREGLVNKDYKFEKEEYRQIYKRIDRSAKLILQRKRRNKSLRVLKMALR